MERQLSQERLAYGEDATRYLESRGAQKMLLMADAIWQLAHPLHEEEAKDWIGTLVMYCQTRQENRIEIQALWAMAGGDKQVIEDIFSNLPSK